MLEAAIRLARRNVIVEVELSLAAGESLALFGRSGAGKTTILRCLAGLLQPDSGRVLCGGEVWYPPSRAVHRRDIGYLSQQPCLFPHLSVEANVSFALPRAERRAEHSVWLRHLRARFGLEACWTAAAGQLSSGQAQRVALARLLARRPRLVLLDEPFAGLDRAGVRELLEVLHDWHGEFGFALLAADHQPDALRLLTEKVIYLEQGRAAAGPETWDELERRADAGLRALLQPLEPPQPPQPPMRTMARAGLRNSGSPM
ncbi:MAG: ATP-binding cassette domain-containing protein [Terriglobales bacterium]